MNPFFKTTNPDAQQYITDELKIALQGILDQLHGSARRWFMAGIVKAAGKGAASFFEREMGWNRNTIRKGIHELDSGIICASADSMDKVQIEKCPK